MSGWAIGDKAVKINWIQPLEVKHVLTQSGLFFLKPGIREEAADAYIAINRHKEDFFHISRVVDWMNAGRAEELSDEVPYAWGGFSGDYRRDGSIIPRKPVGLDTEADMPWSIGSAPLAFSNHPSPTRKLGNAGIDCAPRKGDRPLYQLGGAHDAIRHVDPDKSTAKQWKLYHAL